jgi:hypothetical protein
VTQRDPTRTPLRAVQSWAAPRHTLPRPTAVALTVLLLVARGPGMASAATKVTRKPVAVARHTFDPQQDRPAKMPALSPGEDAVTATGFGVGTQLRKSQTTRRLPDGRYRTSVSVDQLQVELEMTIDIWLPTDAAEKLKAHEEGHRVISERVYAEVADRAARVAGDAVDGRRYTGEGDTAAEAEAAATAAVGAAISQVNKAY